MAQSHNPTWLKAFIASSSILWLIARMTERKPQVEDKYVVRFPDGMRDQLKQLASENGRSLNAEIIYRLQSTLEMDAYVPEINAHIETEDDAFNRVRSLLSEVDALLANADKIRKSGDR